MSRFAFVPRSTLLIGAAIGLLPASLHAYDLLGGSWPTGNITMQLQLDATAPSTPVLPLTDGAASWNSVAQSTLDEWNSALGRSRFVGVTNATRTARLGNGLNNVLFSNTVYDSAFDSLTLAVTLVDNYDDVGISTVKTSEADLIVNTNRSWNSYRGRINSSPLDLRRVLLHELGHVLGLDHPDLAVPAQSLASMMNSTISNLETLQADDRSGAAYLYATPLIVPRLTQQPTNQTATVSSSARFTISVNDETPPPPARALLSYKWYFRATGTTAFEKLFTLDTPDLDFGSVQPLDAGSYFVEIMTPDSNPPVRSNTVTLTVNPTATSSATALANLSTRGVVPAPNDSRTSAMIVGFVVTGSREKQVLLRAIGPTLGGFGVSGTLADPVLTLKNSTAATLATSPAVWDSGNGAALRIAMSSVGAFALPAGSRDAVILATLPPGNYTAQTTSPAGASGVVLVEVYDADSTADPSSRLANLATRGYTGTGANLLIAGFVVQGPGPRTYLIRLAGASLGAFGVNDTLDDPYLKLFNNTTSAQIRETDDWDSPSIGQPALEAAFRTTGAFTFTERRESAMLVTLQPGSYTAQASGNDNAGSTSPTGNTLIEIYEMP